MEILTLCLHRHSVVQENGNGERDLGGLALDPHTVSDSEY